jgi:hypothetical protein
MPTDDQDQSEYNMSPPVSHELVETRRLRCRIYLAFGLWLLTLGYCWVAFSQLGAQRACDFTISYLQGHALREGRDPYAPADFAAVRNEFPTLPAVEVDRATDPPTFVLMVEPLSRVHYNLAYWLWVTLNVVALAGGLFLILKPLARRLDHPTLWIIAALAVLYHPVNTNWSYGQSKIIIFFLLALTLRSMESGHEALAGASLALAAMLRAFPILLLGYLAMQRRWRVVAYAGAALLIGGVGTLLFVGTRISLSFFSALPYLTGPVLAGNLGNIAPNAVAARILSRIMSDCPRMIVPHFVQRIIAWTPGGLTLILTLKVTAAKAPLRDLEWRLFSLWVATALMLLPVAWQYDLVVLLIPFLGIASAVICGHTSVRALVAAVFSYLLPTLEWGLRHLSTMPGARVASLVYPVMVDFQVLALVTAYLSTYWFVTDVRDGFGGGEPSR